MTTRRRMEGTKNKQHSKRSAKEGAMQLSMQSENGTFNQNLHFVEKQRFLQLARNMLVLAYECKCTDSIRTRRIAKQGGSSHHTKYILNSQFKTTLYIYIYVFKWIFQSSLILYICICIQKLCRILLLFVYYCQFERTLDAINGNEHRIK